MRSAVDVLIYDTSRWRLWCDKLHRMDEKKNIIRLIRDEDNRRPLHVCISVYIIICVCIFRICVRENAITDVEKICKHQSKDKVSLTLYMGSQVGSICIHMICASAMATISAQQHKSAVHLRGNIFAMYYWSVCSSISVCSFINILYTA